MCFNLFTMMHRRQIATFIISVILGCADQILSFTPPHRGECRFFLDTGDTSEVRPSRLQIGLHFLFSSPILILYDS